VPRISISLPHALGQEQSIRRLKEGFHSLSETYKDQIHSLQEEWNGNVLSYRFTALGISVTGTVTAEPAEVTLVAELPMMAMMFKGRIEKQLREELAKMLA